MNIPVEAVEAAAFQLYKIDHYGNPDAWPTDEQLAKGRSIFDPPPTLDEFKADYMREAKEVLEAAAPYMLKELRELVEQMEAQPWTEVGTIQGVAALIRSSTRGLLGGASHQQAAGSGIAGTTAPTSESTLPARRCNTHDRRNEPIA
jgi:hypothetical protein